MTQQEFNRHIFTPMHEQITYVDYGLLTTKDNKYMIFINVLDIDKRVLQKYHAIYDTVNDALQYSTKSIIFEHVRSMNSVKTV